MKLAKVYEPGQYEPSAYALWETANAFAPRVNEEKGTYSIVMPPPNANGNLHVGHALMVEIEDVLIRYNRMKGKSTVWLPGADHAGFETWVVFERYLESQGKSRFDFTRDELYQMTWDFVASHRGSMELQLRELGASADWNNLTFTLDKKVIATAYQTFKMLWDDGLIYRGKRLVNYCTYHHTGFADIEVEYKEQTSPLYYLKYGPFTLATTRPETKFGDTGVAVHPDDERYKQYIGQEIEVEGVNGTFTVTVVGDTEVDPNFGTGVVKITPAHDFTDWEIGERHNLPVVQVINEDGTMNEKAGQFAGLPVDEARQAVVQALTEKGLLVKIDEHYRNRVGTCYKCKTIIQPMLMDQWFLKVRDLADRSIAALEKNEIAFHPDNKRRVLINYLKGLKDWNLSRQTPWGIPIPAFQNTNDPSDWIFDEGVESETLEREGKTYKRDPDTFDTWFSSGQWPFITTDATTEGELRKFYPIDVMETGHDILFPWVSRMIMLGLYRTNQVPFKNVYLHGLVLDEKGIKMSKSKGNVIAPKEVVAEYGSDALRMGLLANRSAGLDQAFSTASVVAGRNFANKLWNMARYIENTIGDDYQDRTPVPQSAADHWVLHKLQHSTEVIGTLIEQYRFAEACETLYHTVWNDVADWYIEASKVSLNKPLLAYVLETILRVSHPFAPFVTETIWQTLKWEDGLLILAEWPENQVSTDPKVVADFAAIQQLVGEVRFLQNELGTHGLELQHKSLPLLQQEAPLINKLGRVTVVEAAEPKGIHIAHVSLPTWLSVDEKTLNGHVSKLQDRLLAVEAHLVQLHGRLHNDSYINNAPAHIVQQTRDEAIAQQALKERLEQELQAFTQA